MNNEVFGKMRNVKKHKNIELVIDDEKGKLFGI